MKEETPLPDPDDRDWRAFYRHLQERHEVHKASALKRSKRYKSLATFLHIAIPLISISIALILARDLPHAEWIGITLGTLLAVLSGVNSAFAPARRFRQYVERLIELHDWLVEFELRIDLLDKADSKGMANFLKAENSRLSGIGRLMADLPIPRPPQE